MVIPGPGAVVTFRPKCRMGHTSSTIPLWNMSLPDCLRACGSGWLEHDDMLPGMSVMVLCVIIRASSTPGVMPGDGGESACNWDDVSWQVLVTGQAKLTWIHGIDVATTTRGEKGA